MFASSVVVIVAVITRESVRVTLRFICLGTVAADKPEEDPSLGPSFKPTGTCFRCGQDGHWARQCRGGQGNFDEIFVDCVE